MEALRGALHLNLLLALGASSIVAATALIGGQPPSPLAIAVAFMSVFAVYNLDRIADRTEGEGSTSPKRTALLSRLAPLIRVSVGGSALVVGVIALASGGVAAAWICSFPLAGVLYVAPIFAGRRLKDIPCFKSFYVPGCWALFVGIAVGVGDLVVDSAILCFAALVFALTFASCWVGDLRDVDVDAQAGVRTLAVVIGRQRSIVVLVILQALTVIGWVLAVLVGWVPVQGIALLVPAAIGYFFFRRFVDGRGESELVLELYDLELVMLAPSLWIAAAM